MGRDEMVITIELDSEEESWLVAKALSVDDDEYVATSSESNKVVARFTADSLSALRRAADDWMACLMALVRTD